MRVALRIGRVLKWPLVFAKSLIEIAEAGVPKKVAARGISL